MIFQIIFFKITCILCIILTCVSWGISYARASSDNLSSQGEVNTTLLPTGSGGLSVGVTDTAGTVDFHNLVQHFDNATSGISVDNVDISVEDMGSARAVDGSPSGASLSPPSSVDLTSTDICHHQCITDDSLPGTCPAPTFNNVIFPSTSNTQCEPCINGRVVSACSGGIEISMEREAKKISCSPRNISDLDEAVVRIVNSSELLLQLGPRNSTAGRCTVVLFYAPWCTFSARVAPHYNALARAFATLDIVAIDAFHFSNLNSRYGTIAVPNIMVFHNAKAVARFNGTERNLSTIAAFVSNITGVEANLSVSVDAADYIGPLASQPTTEPDYLLALSWLFVIICLLVGGARSAVGVRVWNTLIAIGHHEERQHQHIN